jgi:hypothetical protein
MQLARIVDRDRGLAIGDGPSRIHLRIAGLTISLETDSVGPPIHVEGVLNSFVVTDGQPDIAVRATWGTLDTPPRGRLLFDSGGVWQLHEDGGNFVYSFSSPSFANGFYRRASFDRDFRQGVVTLDRASFANRPAAFPLEYPLDELMVINRLTAEDGIEVHGCGVVDVSGQGYLFAGQSGAGKSTIARLWANAGATVVSDDRVVVRAVGDGLAMHGTPWHGDAEFAEPIAAPLSAILMLRKAPRHALVPLPVVHRAALLFSCTFPVFHSTVALERTLALLGRLVGTVPVSALEFAPTADVVSFVRGQHL